MTSSASNPEITGSPIIASSLFNGVTSSGKAEIYIKLIQSILKENNRILYLVPEIALTTQIITRLQFYFGDQISVFHSKYSMNERVEVWNNLLENKTKTQTHNKTKQTKQNKQNKTNKNSNFGEMS